MQTLGTIKSFKPFEIKEEIVIRMNTNDEGELRIPVGGRCVDNKANKPYDWQVSYDGGEPVQYTGTGGSKSIVIASGLEPNSNHEITIKPTVEDYGWAYAFGFYGTGVQKLLTDIIYDSSFMGYAPDATTTGNYFRANQYGGGCVNLKVGAIEYMPDTVTTVGNRFRHGQYSGSGLLRAPREIMSKNVISLGLRFRNSTYSGCIDLYHAAEEVFPDSIQTIGQYFRSFQYGSQEDSVDENTKLKFAPDEKLNNNIIEIPDNFRYSQYAKAIALEKPAKEFINEGVTVVGNNFRCNQYFRCENLKQPSEESLPNNVITIGYNFRYQQYWSCSSLKYSPNEVMGNNVTSIGSSFRSLQFSQCTSLETAGTESLSNQITEIQNTFRYGMYHTCSSLKQPADEVLNNNITTLGDYFRYCQYINCENITYAAEEKISNSLVSVGSFFRGYIYQNCYNLSTPSEEAFSNNVVTIGDSFRKRQYIGTKITKAPNENISDLIENIPNEFRYSQYSNCYNLIEMGEEKYPQVLQSIGDDCRSYQYSRYSNPGTSLYNIIESDLPNTVNNVGENFKKFCYQSQLGINTIHIYSNNIQSTLFRNLAFDMYGYEENTNNIYVYIHGDTVDNSAKNAEPDNPKCTEAAGLALDYVSHIYVKPELVEDYKQSDNWGSFGDKIVPMP